jgi:hypothetical protein
MHCIPLDPAFVSSVRAGGPDANGQPAERHKSDSAGNPCRHCLDHVPDGAGLLILAARPFPAPQPFAETGPIFLCADACAPWAGDGVPPVLRSSPDYLVKAYSADHRIRYGTGRITPAAELWSYAETLLSDPATAYVDVRSARNNCFLTRMVR